MNESKPGSKFWMGNAILGVALLMILNMGQLWASLGAGAMVLWILVVAVGVYLLMSDKNDSGDLPD